MKIPLANEIKKARTDAGLSQASAAELVYVTPRAWQNWESGERKMHPAFWALFRIAVSRLNPDTGRE